MQSLSHEYQNGLADLSMHEYALINHPENGLAGHFGLDISGTVPGKVPD